MRILSSFKDYYDNIFPYDKEDVIFVREQEEIKKFHYDKIGRSINNPLFPKFELPLLERPRFIGSPITYSLIVGVCGKFYLALENGYKTPNNYLDQAVAFSFNIQRKEVELEKNRYGTRYNPYPFNNIGWNTLNNYLKSIINHEIFRQLNTPIFSYHNDNNGIRIIKNPCLKKYNFQTIIDPYTLAQEIDMYLNSHLVGQKDVPAPMTDELKIHSHGFDKYSFKKCKNKK